MAPGAPDPVRARRPQDLDVPVAPLAAGGGPGGSRTPRIAAVALVIAVLAAIGLAQAFPAAPDVPVVGAPSLDARIPERSGPTTAPAPFPVPPRLRAAELVSGVLDGSLEGRLVYADALLRTGCRPGGAATCASPQLAVAGLGLDVVPGAAAVVGSEGVPAGAMLVLAVRGPRLEYLGSLVAHRDGAPTLAELTNEVAAGNVPVSPTLRDVAGWLVIDPACVTPGGGSRASCGPRPPFLAEDEPLADGLLRSERGGIVALSPDLWGVDPAVDTVSEGPFLVTATAGGIPEWEIVARYDPSRSVRVVIP